MQILQTTLSYLSLCKYYRQHYPIYHNAYTTDSNILSVTMQILQTALSHLFHCKQYRQHYPICYTANTTDSIIPSVSLQIVQTALSRLSHCKYYRQHYPICYTANTTDSIIPSVTQHFSIQSASQLQPVGSFVTNGSVGPIFFIPLQFLPNQSRICMHTQTRSFLFFPSHSMLVWV